MDACRSEIALIQIKKSTNLIIGRKHSTQDGRLVRVRSELTTYRYQCAHGSGK